MSVTAPTPAALPARIASIDLLRGLDVLLMLFVNEMAGVAGTPAFLLHLPATADGMTITDVVFPAFLFVTGMTIPIALSGRLRRGASRAAVWRHVLSRSVALIVIGVFMVNAEQGIADGPLPPALWNILMTVAVVLTWSVTDRPEGGSRGRARVAVGVALLVALALLYRSTDIPGAVQFTPRWWGILGLIGWAYLVAATAWLAVGDDEFTLIGVVVLLYLVALADLAGQVPSLEAIGPFMNVGGVLGAHGALVLSGTVLVVLLRRHDAAGRPRRAFAWPALVYTAGLAMAGLLLHTLSGLHQAFWINKVLATPAWCLLSAACTAAAWIVLFLVADVAGWRRAPLLVQVAGENALVVYLMAPFLLSVFALSTPLFGGINPYYALASPFAVGVARSVLFALAAVWLVGWMRRRGLRMQL